MSNYRNTINIVGAYIVTITDFDDNVIDVFVFPSLRDVILFREHIIDLGCDVKFYSKSTK